MDAMADLVLFDGVCGLCNRLIQFLLRRDGDNVFLYAPLQSTLGQRLVSEHGADPTVLDTFYVIADYQSATPRMLARSAAAFQVLKRLHKGYRLLTVFEYLPSAWRDAAYNFVARRRHRWFKPLDACQVVPPHQQAKFLA